MLDDGKFTKYLGLIHAPYTGVHLLPYKKKKQFDEKKSDWKCEKIVVGRQNCSQLSSVC